MRLVSSFLECSKGRDTFRPAARNIVDTVERAIRMTSVRQEFRRITIKHHHKGLAVGWFDSNRLERVVANLVLNACEAVSPDSGQIVITTTGNQACLQIGVWDNGPGIPPAIQDSVFQPFVSYGKAEGSGLGLAIAKKIVEDHGGEIYLDGRSETGTLFKITIPFAIPWEQSRSGLKNRTRAHGYARNTTRQNDTEGEFSGRAAPTLYLPAPLPIARSPPTNPTSHTSILLAQQVRVDRALLLQRLNRTENIPTMTLDVRYLPFLDNFTVRRNKESGALSIAYVPR